MKKLFIIIFWFGFLFACKEPYISPVTGPTPGYLVVDGVINSGPGATSIRLSRTTVLTDASRVMETGATVMVQDENSQTYPLTETARGVYMANALNLDVNQKYRLRIVANNKEYLSDYVSVNNNPPVDSISWRYTPDGVHIAANTHDPQNTAKYFGWDYVETWEFHSDYVPETKYDAGNPYFVVYFDPIIYYLRDSSMYKCWKSDTSSQFILGSTIKYDIDTLSNELTVIQPASEKLSALYSINVRQYAYSKDGYEFLQKMKKNTEQLGSVFDAQPSELQGNIHCTAHPDEIVVGNVSVCPIQEKRIFISNDGLPGWNYSSGCVLIQSQNNDTAYIRMNNYAADGKTVLILPVDYITRNPSTPPPNGVIFTFSAADKGCVDCKLRGTNIKPPFWP